MVSVDRDDGMHFGWGFLDTMVGSLEFESIVEYRLDKVDVDNDDGSDL